MAGILILIIFSAYLMLAFWLMDKAKTFRKKGLMLMLLILIPTADEIYYAKKLNNYCENIAGLRLNKKIPINAGIYFGRWSGALYFDKKLLNFVEYESGLKQKLYRLTRNSSNKTKKELAVKVESQYRYLFIKEKKTPFLIQTHRIEDIKTMIMASEYKTVAYYGGWFRRVLLGGLSDSGPTKVAGCVEQKPFSPMFELFKKSISK